MAKTVFSTGDDLLASFLNKLNNAVPTGDNNDGALPLLHAQSGGTGAAYTMSLSFGPASTQFPQTYQAGLMVTFRAHAANTGAATMNINSIGDKDIRRPNGVPLQAGDIQINDFVVLLYDGTNDYFVFVNCWQVRQRCFAADHLAAASINPSTWTKIPIDNEIFDPDSNFDSVTNYRWSPIYDGQYFLFGMASIDNATAGQISSLAIYKNGAAIASVSLGTDGTVGQDMIVWAAADVTVGDYFELYIWHNFGTAQNCDNARFASFLIDTTV